MPILLAVAVSMGLLRLFYSSAALEPPYVYQKDFIQEYLMGAAARAGLNPYLPISDLADQLMEAPPTGTFRHPTPHPPVVALVALPLAALSYRHAAALWFVFEICCFVLAVYLLLPAFARNLGALVLASLVALNWPPVFDELVTGQLMLVLLVLHASAWRLLRSGRVVRAGSLLGAIFALKLMAWPILIFLLVRKRWSAVAAAGVVVVGANCAAAALVGLGTVWTYYRNIGPSVAALYRNNAANFSLWSLGWRLFEGTGSNVVYSIAAPPLVLAPGLASTFAWGLPAVLLALGLVLAIKMESLDATFSMLVCTNILIGPVAWSHYLTLTLIPIAVVTAAIGAGAVSRVVVRRFVFTIISSALLCSLPLGRLALLFATDTRVHRTLGVVPFAAGVITLTPAVIVIGVMWIVWHTDRVSHQQTFARTEAPNGVTID